MSSYYVLQITIPLILLNITSFNKSGTLVCSISLFWPDTENPSALYHWFIALIY